MSAVSAFTTRNCYCNYLIDVIVIHNLANNEILYPTLHKIQLNSFSSD